MTEASTVLVDDVLVVEPSEIVTREPVMTRAARERARRARSRRNQLVAAAAALLIGGVAALVTSPRDDASPHTSPAPAGVRVATSPARAVLVAHYDRSRRIDLVAVAGVHAGGAAGSFVFLPAPTVVDVPALELQPVGSLLRVGNRSLLIDVIENTTGVRIGQVALLDDDALARAFASVRTLTVTFPHPVTITDSGGTLTYPGGRIDGVLPSQAVRLLTGRESGGTLTHLATMQAVLEAYFDALRHTPGAARRAGAVRGAGPFTALAGVTALHYDVFPVSSSDAVGGERFEIRRRDLDAVVRSEFGFARIGGAARRPRVELLNGVGTAGLTQRVARIVVPAGGYVTLTNNLEGFNERVTRVVYYDDRQLNTARHFARVLRARSVVKGAIALDSVDITVVIGSDFVGTLS